MRVLKRFGAVILLSLALAGCSDIYQYNEKVTLEVETPTGVKTASAVQTVRKTHTYRGLPEAKGVRTNFKGEAVVLEVLPDQYLFALFSSKRNRSRRYGLFYNNELAEVYQPALGLIKGSYKHGTVKERYDLTMRLKGKAVAIPHKIYPLLVTFKDINDPASVELVDPDNLAATFGQNIQLKRITIEITDEPVTRGKVEKVLGWLEKLKGGYLHGGFTSKGAPLGLHGGNFKVGD